VNLYLCSWQLYYSIGTYCIASASTTSPGTGPTGQPRKLGRSSALPKDRRRHLCAEVPHQHPGTLCKPVSCLFLLLDRYLPYFIIMSFSSLVSDLTYRDDDRESRVSHLSRARSYASTAATSVSISGDISSQLHGGYSHPLARAWQAERQLTKVSNLPFVLHLLWGSHC